MAALLTLASRRLLHCSYRQCTPLKARVENTLSHYEQLIGLADVKQAQNDVVQCEERLSAAQLLRRDKQMDLKKLQNRIKEIHGELDRTPRGDDRYLHLLTEEHAAIKQEQALLDDFEGVENAEREAFHMLSTKVRWSHEKEREYGERTKYWSISASLVGALLGILGTSIGNELRMRRIKEMIPTSQEVRPLLQKITDLVHSEHQQVAQFVSEMKEVLRLDSPKLAQLHLEKPAGAESEIVNAFQAQLNEVTGQLKELKRLVALDQALAADPNAVVYVGDEMEDLLRQTEKNIESKMKLQTLVTVVVAYAVLGVAAPLLYLWLNNQ
uniref:Coiled-coil domain-containing protein 51 n=1 Tax=Panagrellus redivivus TaxID=6233 RepID=A0A7E4ULV0_PANRE